MKKQLISLETAKLAKEKGFNLNSQAYYSCDNPSSGLPNQLILRDWEKWINFGNGDSPQEGTMIYSAPTQFLLQKWLREKYYIDIIIKSEMIGYGYLLYNRFPPKNITNINIYQYYEEALEAGLFEALKLIE